MTSTTPRRRVLVALAGVLALLAPAAPWLGAPAQAAARPVLTGVAADTGRTSGGDFVTLRGTGLSGAYVVSFGSARTRNLHVWSSTEITVRTPPHGVGTVAVRVARPGSASASTTLARYTYDPPSYVSPGLAPSGTPRAAPAVSTLTGGSKDLATDLSCVESFCGAVGDLGVSTYDGTSWTAVTPTGSGSTRPQISCDDGFCMAVTADAHRWRFSDGAWTDLGALPGIRSLDCLRGVCIAVAAGLAHVYQDGAWKDGQSVLTGGVAGASCAWDGCVVNGAAGWFRIYSFRTSTWAPQRPMFDSSALRTSSLTRGITGDLQCPSRAWCTSAGQPDRRTGVQKIAIFTGRAWSIGQARQTSLAAPATGTTRLKECRFTFACLMVAYGTSGTGGQFRDWTALRGVQSSRNADAGPTRTFNSISCWETYRCLGIEQGTYQPVDDVR